MQSRISWIREDESRLRMLEEYARELEDEVSALKSELLSVMRDRDAHRTEYIERLTARLREGE